MNAASRRDTDVLIVGAGPTGLVLALWLTLLGIRVRIVDKTEQPGTTSRALAVHARTLELYRQIGFADTVIARGRKMTAANLWAAGKQVARAVLGDIGVGISPFPYVLIVPQDEHECLLHVYGEATPEIRTLCRERGVPLHVLPWGAQCLRAGLARNAVYLVRPDGYVAFADPGGLAAGLSSYLDAHKLSIA